MRNDLDEEWRIMRRVLEEFFYPLATDPEFGRQTQAWLGEPLMYPWDTGILKIIDNLVIAAMKS